MSSTLQVMTERNAVALPAFISRARERAVRRFLEFRVLERENYRLYDRRNDDLNAGEAERIGI